jgi:hypothetical protein
VLEFPAAAMVTGGLQQAGAESTVQLDGQSDDAVGQDETGLVGVYAGCGYAGGALLNAYSPVGN